MTERANRLIDTLLEDGASGFSVDAIIQVLRKNGLLPTEVGWVLHHVKGLSMPYAVHLAKVARVVVHRATPLAGHVGSLESLQDDAGAVHRHVA